MDPLEIRLLGGFEISLGSQPVGRFESQRVRALLAYLVSQPGRSFSRDHLLGIFWPQHSEAAARHNLRQALYNLRGALGGHRRSSSPIVSDHRTVRFARDAGVMIDVAAFEAAIARGWNGGHQANPQELARAVQIFRGDFLAGFYLDESPGFEEWMLGEQQRLRDAAATALRALVSHHLQAGSYALATQHARKLLLLDPLSEEVHRQLMLLYTLSGRRSRALEDYEQLRQLLAKELGEEPLEETKALYEQILNQTLEGASVQRKAEPAGPMVALVGRAAEVAVLRSEWRDVERGRGRVTLLAGEAGVGKTRLARSFLHEITSQGRATVLLGRGYELAPPQPFKPLTEALRHALACEVEISEGLAQAPPSAALADLARLAPELAELKPELLPLLAGPSERLSLERLAASFALFLRLILHGSEDQRRIDCPPLILFLDNLQTSDGATLRLAARLAREIADLPVWLLLACRPEVIPEALLAELSGATGQGIRRLELERLDAYQVAELAGSLVGREDSPLLSEFLFEKSAGLPILITEWINYLWDEGALMQIGSGWYLAVSPEELARDKPASFDELVLRRVNLLPASSRRLLTLAAILGQRFDAALLARAEREDEGVVESCLELLLQRWLVRHFPRYWADSRKERDVALLAQGARRGTFEFAHQAIRRAISHSLNPDRARYLHGRISKTLEEEAQGEQGPSVEELGYHLSRAGQWQRAASCFFAAGQQAALLDPEIGRTYFELALNAVDEAARAGQSSAETPSRAEVEAALRGLAEV